MSSAVWIVVALVAGLCAVPVCAIVWLAARLLKKLQEENRDLLKAVLSLSEKPAATTLAMALEGTERAEMENDVRMVEARTKNRQGVHMPIAGSGR